MAGLVHQELVHEANKTYTGILNKSLEHPTTLSGFRCVHRIISSKSLVRCHSPDAHTHTHTQFREIPLQFQMTSSINLPMLRIVQRKRKCLASWGADERCQIKPCIKTLKLLPDSWFPYGVIKGDTRSLDNSTSARLSKEARSKAQEAPP